MNGMDIAAMYFATLLNCAWCELRLRWCVLKLRINLWRYWNDVTPEIRQYAIEQIHLSKEFLRGDE